VAGLSFTAPLARLALADWPRIRGDVVLQAGGAPQVARADIELKRREGTIVLTAALTPELLRLAADRFGFAAAKWVTLAGSASLQAQVDLAAGWTPVRAEGDISVRDAIAHDVSIDAAGGHIVYAGHGLDVTDLTLFQGDNAAYGSYAMDTRTLQYRFLLHGHLRPLDISGWFTDWWPRFWKGFDFAATPPVADVDVAGRWGTAQESVVFCQAFFARRMRPGRESSACHLTGLGPRSSFARISLRCRSSRRSARIMWPRARSPLPSIPKTRRIEPSTLMPYPILTSPNAPGSTVPQASRWPPRCSFQSPRFCESPAISTVTAPRAAFIQRSIAR
jgi:hypothetical protein